MGKTTLAQHVCNEENIAKKFKVIWVRVSTTFDATSVTSKILESLTGEKPSAVNLEALQQNLKQELNSVKFFLVLDDVWEDKEKEEWEKIFAPLRKGMSGSKILVTTRMRSVVDTVGSAMGVKCECLELEGLKEADNLMLFSHHVFSGRNPHDFSDLIETGKQIVKELRGCPLVTKVVSGHLQDNMSFEYWNHFLHEDLEHFQGTKHDIMKILRLSYYYLPTEHQICFRYCSLFPQDYKFQKKDLVLMWIGSGLISQDGDRSSRIEDTGDKILAKLTRNSFFDMKFKIIQYSQRKEEYYVMHDLMHELARHVSSGECTTIVDSIMLDNEKDTIRHLRIACIQKVSIEDVKKITRFKNLRSIIIDGPGFIDKDTLHAVESVIESAKSLRLLRSNLQNTYDLPKLGDLKHLRYFSLYRISTKVICGLVKLYHLVLVDCLNDWKEEPRQLRYLGNIDHLRYVNYGPQSIGEFPIARLTSLQELRNYRVQGSKGNKVSALRNLNTLRELKVLGLENVESLEEAGNAKLNKKIYLESLSLLWSARASVENSEDDLILDHLEPHASIRNLKIFGYAGTRLPIWIENLHVKNLVSLELARCMYWEHLPSLAELTHLKKIWLECLPSLQVIGQPSQQCSITCMDSYFPPSIETLIIRCCRELKQLPILPPSLVHLELSKVGLTKFPSIGSLHNENIGIKPSKLMFVIVEECASLEGSLLLQTHYTRTIRILRITDCKELEFVPLLFKGMSELRELSVINCPKVRTSSELEGKILPPSLEKLTIKQSGDIECFVIKSLHGLSNLSELVLENCLSLESLPSPDVCKSFKSLKFMEITGCKNLQTFGGLGSLEHLIALKISACSKLTEVRLPVTLHASTPASSACTVDDCIEEESLVASASSLLIDYLEVDLPSILNIEPLKSLCHTKGLIIRDGTQMECLPEQWLLQNHKELQSLKVLSANSLESLPVCMKELRSLNFLLLSGAEKLRSLSDLPSSLQWLHVMGCCPDLETNVRVKDSLEWNKISYIPKVHIATVKTDQSGLHIFHAGYYFMYGKECSEDTIYGSSNPSH
ncbi:hypothetical protein QOZ80_5AG0384930 [Eleusine coracana subsp. coracana]|nr:hypothetical protein QOZ80_5AG0384930 [Eleusine coracana subsp. coracana]